jgi:RNA polymerase sigma factor (sigma-70 family)
MAIKQTSSVLRHLRKAALGQDGGGMTDGQLLRSFLARHDEAAFEALVRRHGPMVLGVCRRVLGHAHDAEDAFQASFLVLVRKAAALTSREVVGDWLHGVAYRTALKARTAEARRRFKERQMSRSEARTESPRPDWQPLLDQELNGLPEKYRVPVVLCDLEGRTRKEAARQLGWPEGTLSGRLSRARRLLANRLARRGLTLSAGALATGLGREALAAGVPGSLVDPTVKAALLVAAGQATAGVISAQVAALTEGVVKAMLLTKLKGFALVLLMLTVLAVGVGVLRHATAAGPDGDQDDSQPQPIDRKFPAAKAKPAIPVPEGAEGHKFQVSLTLTKVRAGQRQVMATPNLVILDGKEASFAAGGEQPVQMGDKVEFVTVGPAVRCIVQSDTGGKVRLDMTLSHTTKVPGEESAANFATTAVRVLRHLNLGEAAAAKLRTNDPPGTTLEVSTTIWETDVGVLRKTIASGEKDLRMAEFYRRTGHPGSAYFNYELIARRYPGTLYAKRAKERMAELKKQMDKAPKAEAKAPARVGQIVIVGNRKTPDSVILEQVPLYPGQVLHYDDLRKAEQNLAQLKRFKARPRVTVVDGEDTGEFKDVLITVEED